MIENCKKMLLIGGLNVLPNMHMKWEIAENVMEKAKNYSLNNKHEIFLMGDLHARHAMWGDSKRNENGKVLAALRNNSQKLLQIINKNESTFISSIGTSLIDLFICSPTFANDIVNHNTDKVEEHFSGAPLRGHMPVWIYLVENTKRTAISEVLDLESTNWNSLFETMEHLCCRIAMKRENVNSSTFWNELKVSLSTATNLHKTKKKSM